MNLAVTAMNLAVTTEHLLELTKSADLLRATAERAMKADTLERALHAARLEKDAWESQANDHYKDSRTWRERYEKEAIKNGELESDLKKWKEHLNGEVDRRLMMERGIAELLPPPADDDARPQFDRLLERLRLANDANRAWDDLMIRCDALKGEVVTADNHAACRLNVLGEIHRILGSDGSPTGVNVLTGVPPEYARLPKRIEQLLADVTTWRERYDKEVIKNGELVRENAAVKDDHHAMWNRVRLLESENETLARNMPPEPPAEVAATPDLVYVGQQRWCRSGRTSPDDAVVLRYRDGWVVLCESWMDRETGKLTDIPVPVRDLPEVSAL